MTNTEKMLKGVLKSATATVLAFGMSGCGNAQNVSRPDEPNDSSCDEWEYEEEYGVFECEDDGSMYRDHYYYGGMYYPSSSALKKSSKYKSYAKSSNFVKTTSKTSGKTGVGSGTKGGFGG